MPTTHSNNVNTARTLANMLRRSQTLFREDGYTWEKFKPEYPNTYAVESPAGALYFVNTSHQTCTCEAFAHYDNCKHLMAVNAEEDFENAMIAAYETAGGADFEEWRMATYAGC